MRLIVDANILLAALIRDSSTRALLLDERLELIAPDALVIEVKRHVETDEEIRRKSHLSQSQLVELSSILCSQIRIVDRTEYWDELAEGFRLATHPEDAPYLALGLKTGVPVWSNDAGMARQKQVQVLTTAEVFHLLDG